MGLESPLYLRRARAAILVIAATCIATNPAAAQISQAIVFDAATAPVMQGNLDGGPNQTCPDKGVFEGDQDVYPGSFSFRNGDPTEDHLYQSYVFFNNGPQRCVNATLTWYGDDCGNLEIGLSMYLGDFNPNDPTENLIAHSWDTFSIIVNPNDYYHSPGFVPLSFSTMLDAINVSALVPALAKVTLVLDSRSHPGTTLTCPRSQGAALGLQADRLTPGLGVAVHPASSYEFDPPGGAFLTFNVTLASQLAEDFSVDYIATPGSAGIPGDFSATSGTLTFKKGETLKQVKVPIVSDTTQEVPANETMTLVLSNANPPGIPIDNSNNVGTITDDDDPTAGCRVTSFPGGPLPAGVVGQPYGPLDLDPNGGDQPLQYEWTIGAGATPPGVNLSTATIGGELHGQLGGTPTQAGDFAFTVHLICHLIDNGIDETDVNYTIHVEPEQPQVLITLEDIDVLEGNAGLTPALPQIKLSAPLPADLLLEVQTLDQSATVANNDYDPVTPGQQILIPAGETVEPIPLDIVGDPDVEGDELFVVRLLTPVQKNVVATGFVGVLNDDAVVAEIPTLGPICLALFALTLAGLGAMFLNRPR